MSQDKDALAKLGEAIEKARGLIPGGSRAGIKRFGAAHSAIIDRADAGNARLGDGRTVSRLNRAGQYLASRKRGRRSSVKVSADRAPVKGRLVYRGKRRTGIYKSIDALDEVIEKALRINGGVKVSPKQRRNLAMQRGRMKNSRMGYSRERGPFLGTGNKKRNLNAEAHRNLASRAAVRRRSLQGTKDYGGNVGRARQDARRLLHAYAASRGKASPFKRGMFGGLKRVRKGGEDIHKAKAKTLYVYRPVENAEDILAWARGAGFKSLLPAEKLHVTIIASATEINWANLFDDYHLEPSEDRKAMCDCGPVYRLEDRTKTKTIEGGVREVKKLGNGVVLAFESLSLTQRWIDLRRAGAVSKFPNFQPHITLTLSGDVPKDITPYEGKIVLGEECWEEFNDKAMDGVEEVVTKAALDDLSARLAAAEAELAKTKEVA